MDGEPLDRLYWYDTGAPEDEWRRFKKVKIPTYVCKHCWKRGDSPLLVQHDERACMFYFDMPMF